MKLALDKTEFMINVLVSNVLPKSHNHKFLFLCFDKLDNSLLYIYDLTLPVLIVQLSAPKFLPLVIIFLVLIY